MASANSNIQLTGLDFEQIKNNLKAFLRSQDVIKDLNYEGSVISVLLDVLAYNTHYQAHYLNMVANEMFLDSAVKRGSVISHAKVLGYTPTSYAASYAVINIIFKDVIGDTVTVPKYTKFISGTLNNINYTFSTVDELVITRDPITKKASANNVIIKQGEPLSYRFYYDEKTNPSAIFKLPESTLDVSSLKVLVQNSSSDGRVSLYTQPTDRLALDGTKKVYFVQESLDGFYEIYFGDGILGQKITDGNIIHVSYLSVVGDVVNGLDSFSLVSQPFADYSSVLIETVMPSTAGKEKESIDSIKYIAPKIYSAQERAVTVNDYIAMIQKNSGDFPIDSVNVWSGEDNVPPIYGKVFVAIKPKGGYVITSAQKNIIKNKVLKPMSVLTIDPVIVDVDYTYVQIFADVVYDQSKILITYEQLKNFIYYQTLNFATNYLNKFNAILPISTLITDISNINTSIKTVDCNIKLKKNISPIANTSQTYTVNFSTPIKRDIYRKSVTFNGSFQQVDILAANVVREEVFIEENPSSASSILGIKIISPGFNFTSVPTITIVGDGNGAIAHAEVINGKISKIIVDNPGVEYTQANVVISGGGGTSAFATCVLDTQYGSLRSYYFKNGRKIILNGYAGYVDYINGIVSLIDFKPFKINTNLGILGILVTPESTIVNSTRDKILTLDETDFSSININLIAQ